MSVNCNGKIVLFKRSAGDSSTGPGRGHVGLHPAGEAEPSSRSRCRPTAARTQTRSDANALLSTLLRTPSSRISETGHIPGHGHLHEDGEGTQLMNKQPCFSKKIQSLISSSTRPSSSDPRPHLAVPSPANWCGCQPALAQGPDTCVREQAWRGPREAHRLEGMTRGGGLLP